MVKFRENPLRNLAKSMEWQVLYHRAKEVSGLYLFENLNDFTLVQINFLHWLEVYSSLYSDLAMNEDLISEEVIDDAIRADAYLFYKHKERAEKKIENNTPNRNSGKGRVTDTIIFRGGKNKKGM